MMFIDDNYDDDRQDKIQAILNSAMGSAAKSLSLVIGSQVNVSNPSTHWVNRNNLSESLTKVNLPQEVTLMFQSFRGYLRGEIIVLLESGSKYLELGSLMGYQDKMTSLNIQELNLDIANILSGACINGLSEQLKIGLNFNPPSISKDNLSIVDSLSAKSLHWTDALFMNVKYSVAKFSINASLILCMTEQDSHELYRLIDTQLEQS